MDVKDFQKYIDNGKAKAEVEGEHLVITIKQVNQMGEPIPPVQQIFKRRQLEGEIEDAQARVVALKYLLSKLADVDALA